MDYEAEATQLFVIVIVLVAAYFGVQVWTRRVNNNNGGEGGGGAGGGMMGNLFGGGGSDAGAGMSRGVDDDVDGMGVPAPKGANRNKGRFQLQGRDAEVAAKVLKRMLKQDSGFKDSGEGS
jgi:hypothetical protein